MLVFLATTLRIVTYDPRILGDYRLATKVRTQTLTNEENRVNKYKLLTILLKHVRMKCSAFKFIIMHSFNPTTVRVVA